MQCLRGWQRTKMEGTRGSKWPGGAETFTDLERSLGCLQWQELGVRYIYPLEVTVFHKQLHCLLIRHKSWCYCHENIVFRKKLTASLIKSVIPGDKMKIVEGLILEACDVIEQRPNSWGAAKNQYFFLLISLMCHNILLHQPHTHEHTDVAFLSSAKEVMDYFTCINPLVSHSSFLSYCEYRIYCLLPVLPFILSILFLFVAHLSKGSQ